MPMEKAILKLKLVENLRIIYQKHHKLMFLMVLLLVLGIILLIFSLLNLNIGTKMVKISYGDIGRYQGGEWSSMINSGGYQDGTWVSQLAFPMLAVIFGVFHNLLAIRLFEKRGVGLAQAFVMISISLILATFLVLGRLLGEG